MDKTLLKGLSLLEILADGSNEPKSIEEISALVGLTRSNTHRTLQTLIHAGYIERDRFRGGYNLTMKMFEIGARQLHRLDIRKLAPTYMTLLAKETGDTIHLSVLDGIDVIYIDKIDSLQPVRANSTVGGRAPAYAVATGKALLAAERTDYLDDFEGKLIKHTRSTITDLAALKAELKKIGKLGYAVNRGEWREGVGGIAAAVFDGFGRPVAALGISGPMDRITPVRVKEIAPLLVKCSNELSHAMGFNTGSIRPRRNASE